MRVVALVLPDPSQPGRCTVEQFTDDSLVPGRLGTSIRYEGRLIFSQQRLRFPGDAAELGWWRIAPLSGAPAME